jgi:iron(III) transport system substrate-binding protein
VPVPVGVEPAPNLAALPLDWDALAVEAARLGPALRRWPEGFEDEAGLPPPPARP